MSAEGPRPGARNLITDVNGIAVGNAHDSKLRSGVTAIVCEEPAIAAVHVMGGAPGTRETDLLAPESTVETINAITLSGGSAFGLDSASGVQAHLRERGVGFAVRDISIPIVPTAIIFDLMNGGDKDWGRYAPYREIGYDAAQAAGADFEIGTAGAGYGALAARLKGGLGSASAISPDGITIGALAAINPLGSPTIGETKHFHAAPFELNSEFGGLGLPHPYPEDARRIRIKFRELQRPGMNTAIAVVATDAVLTVPQAKRLAIAAHDGIAHAIWPSHTPMDGDTVFVLATGKSGIAPKTDAWIDLGAIAASTMARAIARGVYEATPQQGDFYPAWRAKFG